jgi:hypothetical protein
VRLYFFYLVLLELYVVRVLYSVLFVGVAVSFLTAVFGVVLLLWLLLLLLKVPTKEVVESRLLFNGSNSVADFVQAICLAFQQQHHQHCSSLCVCCVLLLYIILLS